MSAWAGFVWVQAELMKGIIQRMNTLKPFGFYRKGEFLIILVNIRFSKRTQLHVRK
jgi:hypothetical protein